MTPATLERELVETVARELSPFIYVSYGDSTGVHWSGLAEGSKDICRKAARAVLLSLNRSQNND